MEKGTLADLSFRTEREPALSEVKGTLLFSGHYLTDGHFPERESSYYKRRQKQPNQWME